MCSHSLLFPPSGLGRAPDHHHQALAFAQDLVAAAATINMAGGLRFSFAIGLHTGPAQVRMRAGQSLGVLSMDLHTFAIDPSRVLSMDLHTPEQ